MIALISLHKQTLAARRQRRQSSRLGVLGGCTEPRVLLSALKVKELGSLALCAAARYTGPMRIKLLKVSFVFSLVLVLGGSGCGKDEEAAKAQKTRPDVLAKGDLDALRHLKSADLAEYDAGHEGVFSSIFGAATAEAVIRYLDTRLHYFIVSGDPEESFSPAGIYDLSGDRASTGDPRARLGAANIGMMVWFVGLLSEVQVSFRHHGRQIPVTDSRVGIMLFGEAYEDTTLDTAGRVRTLPSSFRQAILVHEARHSDCTGGITEADLAVTRNAKSWDEFEKNYKARSCGHLHVTCPPSHEFHGILACDDESWGAYAVDAVYLQAMKVVEEKKGDEDAWQIVNAYAIDAKNRLLVTRTGRPDMTSQGLH